MSPLWLVLGAIVLAVVTGRVILARQRQIRVLREIAGRHRLNYSPDDLIGIHERYQNLDMIRRGHNRYAWNVVYGSIEAGLVALFCYRYDVGFGANRTSRQWWVVIIETSRIHGHWRAFPLDAPQSSPCRRRIGAFSIQSDHEASMSELIDAGAETTFQNSPKDYHWEAQGTLIAVAAPMQSDPHVPEQLLTTACELAQRLTDNRREAEAEA